MRDWIDEIKDNFEEKSTFGKVWRIIVALIIIIGLIVSLIVTISNGTFSWQLIGWGQAGTFGKVIGFLTVGFFAFLLIFTIILGIANKGGKK